MLPMEMKGILIFLAGLIIILLGVIIVTIVIGVTKDKSEIKITDHEEIGKILTFDKQMVYIEGEPKLTGSEIGSKVNRHLLPAFPDPEKSNLQDKISSIKDSMKFEVIDVYEYETEPKKGEPETHQIYVLKDEDTLLSTYDKRIVDLVNNVLDSKV